MFVTGILVPDKTTGGGGFGAILGGRVTPENNPKNKKA